MTLFPLAMSLAQYPEYLLPLEFDSLCHNILLELLAITKQLPLPNLLSSWGLADIYCPEVQGLCTLPSKAKRTTTEIKSNFSNKDRWGLKTCAQVSDQIIAKAEKAEYNFLRKEPHPSSLCFKSCIYLEQLKVTFLVPVLHLGFLLLKIKHVILAALTSSWGFEPSKGHYVSRCKMTPINTPIKRAYVHSHPVLLSITKNCIEWDIFSFM